MPRISVITATRNVADTILDCAHDLLQKLGPEDEWVVQDGASEDDTVKLIHKLRDPRIRLESKADGSIYEAFNRATARARGDFYFFIGTDDKLFMHLNDIRDRLQHSDTIYYGDVRVMSSGKRYAGRFTCSMLARKNICHQAIFYPKAVFYKHCYNTRYTLLADWVLNMACWHDPAFRFEYMNCCISRYNDLDGQSARNIDVMFQQDYTRLLRTYFPFRHCWKPWIIHTFAGCYRTVFRRPVPKIRKRSGLPS